MNATGCRGDVSCSSIVRQEHGDTQYQVRKRLEQQEERPDSPLGRRIVLKRRGYVIEFALSALKIKREVVCGAEDKRDEMQKVFPVEAGVSRGCDPHIEEHYRAEEKTEGSRDLIQVGI